jgi:hypothetical protein
MFRQRLVCRSSCSCSSSSSSSSSSSIKLITAVLVLSWSHLAQCQLKVSTLDQERAVTAAGHLTGCWSHEDQLHNMLLWGCLIPTELSVATTRLGQPPETAQQPLGGRGSHLSSYNCCWCCFLQDGTYSAAMMDLACSSDLLFYPSCTDDVATHVQTQLKAAAAAGTGLKIRATHRWAPQTTDDLTLCLYTNTPGWSRLNTIVA